MDIQKQTLPSLPLFLNTRAVRIANFSPDVETSIPPEPTEKPTVSDEKPEQGETQEALKAKLEALEKENQELKSQKGIYESIKAKNQAILSEQNVKTQAMNSIDQAAAEFLSYQDKYPELSDFLKGIKNTYNLDPVSRLLEGKKAIIGELGAKLLNENITTAFKTEILEYAKKTEAEKIQIIEEGRLQEKIEEAYFSAVTSNQSKKAEFNISLGQPKNAHEKYMQESYKGKRVVMEGENGN